MAIDLLQSIGLTKYEAEAYYTLLRDGPLTGYELGKRSKVPLPRAYDVLARLTERGAALVQPGEPARYLAIEIDRVLDRTRAQLDQTLEQLARVLVSASAPDASGEFWVIRGAGNIVDYCREMVQQAQQSIALTAPQLRRQLAAELEAARLRGCRIIDTLQGPHARSDVLLLVIDDREALLGANAADQAVVSNSAAFVEVAHSYLRGMAAAGPLGIAVAPDHPPRSADWLVWEEAKDRRLRGLIRRDSVA